MTAEAQPALPSTQDFARYEFKYLLNQHRCDAIEAEVAQFMTYDGHVNGSLENRYFVRSLYFESPDAVNFYEKIDGVKNRRKFRIRTYSQELDRSVPLFLEQKGRYNERTYKHRIAIDPEDLPYYLDLGRQMAGRPDLMAVPLIESLAYETLRKGVKPVVLVDYLRRPYTSNYDMNFRVTFDSNLRAVAADRMFPGPEAQWFQCDAGYTIMEVKFHRRIPAWFHRILQAHDLRRLSISKFCRGMETCGLAVDLS